jgi:hypothetical protein
MYSKKVFQPSEVQTRQIQELLKSPSFVALKEWAEWEYNEWCKYGMSLVPHLNLMSDEDKSSLEKEYHAIMAVSDWIERIKKVWQEYIGEKIDTK